MSEPKITDEELQALVDGRLEPSRAAALDALVASRPELAARVAAWRRQGPAIADALSPVLDEPVPERLLRAARRPVSPPWRMRVALAAMLVGGVAIGWALRGLAPTGAAGALAAAPLPREAALAHAVYAPEIRHPVEVGAGEQEHLVAWLSKRLGRPLAVPDLSAAGYELVGGRLLPGDQGPAAQFMYQEATGRRLTLYVRVEPAGVPATAFRFTEQGGVRVFHWVDGSLGYALSGELDRDALLSLATRVHRQIAS